MATQVVVTEEYGRNSLKKMTVHDTEVFNTEARFAAALLERWGLVAGKLDGEDSAGRAVLKEMPAAEAVSRACEIAELAMQSFRDRGWMIAAPDVSELLRKTDD